VDISFLIPALNEERNIANCVDAIVASVPEGLRFEVVVGDHGSRDGTADIARAHGARVIAHPRSTVGALRNGLAAASSGALIAFVDADVTLTPEWKRHIAAVREEMGARPLQLAGSHCDSPETDNFFLRNWFSRMRKSTSAYLGTGHLLINRAFFEQLGGFDTRLISGEDYDLCQRARAAGGEIRIVPGLKAIHHDYPLTAAQFVAREAWHGTGDFQGLRAFAHSRVAQLAVLFAGLHVALVAALFVDLRVAALALAALAALPFAASFAKFRGLRWRQRIANVGIFYLYLLGRCASAWPALRRRSQGAR